MRLSSAFDGSFYPAEPAAVDQWVREYLQSAPQPPASGAFGIVVPHAGYVYSGRTAGMALGAVSSDGVKSVVIMGPSHRVPLEGARVFLVDEFSTPLGPLSGDLELSGMLRELLGPAFQGSAFPEHSVEVQLPLVKRAFPEAKVVEIVFGMPDLQAIEATARALGPFAREGEVLLVASSDLSHYHSRKQAQELDGRFRSLLEKGDPRLMAQALQSGETEACGVGPVLTLMTVAQELGGRFRVIHQTDSSEASGDESQVVGYLSAIAVNASGSDG